MRPLLTIDWTRGSNLPQGFQDSDGGVLDNHLITVAGFCSGGLPEDNRRKPGRYPRGFLKKGWSLDLTSTQPDWQRLPDFPGAARQGLSAARVGKALYFWGGFSYTDPYCYSDGWRLSREGDTWKWNPLPALPRPVSSPAMSVVGTRIFAFGGADYDAAAFYTEADRSGGSKRLGARLLVLDTQDIPAGWKELDACPGTPRWVHTMAAIGEKLFVIGGASGNTSRDGTNYGYCSVVDNWTYDTKRQTWSQLEDLPVSSGNFPRSTGLVFKNRYIILPGGHQYDSVLNPDGAIRPKYGLASRANAGSGLQSALIVSFPTFVSGGVEVYTSTKTWGAEIGPVMNLYRSCPEDEGCLWNIDLMGGFRFLQVDEVLRINSASNVIPGNTLPFDGKLYGAPAQISVNDTFDTLNQFYGGNVGFNTDVRYCRTVLSLGAKLAFGVMHERLEINGSSTLVSGPFAQSTRSVVRSGLYANSTNNGRFNNDEFAVIPEVNASLGYTWRSWLTTHVGYNFLFVSRVVRPGNVYSPIVDPAVVPTSPSFGLGGGVAVNNPFMRQSDFWLQGVNFGFTIRY